MTQQPQTMEGDKNSLVGTVSRYAASKFFRQFLGIFTAYLRPKLLSPADFGLWNLLRVLPNYVSYTHLGTHSSMRLLVPRAKGEANPEEESSIINTTWVTTLCIKGFLSLLLLAIGLSGFFEAKVSWGLVSMAASFLLVGLYEFEMNYLKAQEAFEIVTATNYMHIFMSFGMTVAGLWFYGLYGLYVAFPLSHLLTLAYIQYRLPHLPKFHFEWQRFKGLVTFGFPLMIMGVAIMLVQTSDRVLISALLGNEQLGFYGISNMVMGLLMNAPGAAREVLEPRLMRQLNNEDESLIRDHLLAPLRSTSYLMPLLIVPVALCLPVGVSILLPRYIPGILATQILTLGGYFFAHVIVIRGMIVARNLQWRAARLIVIPLVFNIVGSVLLTELGYGIAGVAISSTISFWLLFTLLLWLLSKDMHLKTYESWRKGFKILYLPFPLMTGLMLVAELVYPTPMGWDGVLPACLKTGLIVAIMFGLHRSIGKRGDA